MNYWTALALCAVATPVLADGWDCTMVRECLDEEPCQDTAYEFGFGPLDGAITPFLMSDISGERAMNEIAVLDEPDQRAFVSLVQNFSVGLVSLYPDGRAQYSVHSPDYSVRYSGTCAERG